LAVQTPLVSFPRVVASVVTAPMSPMPSMLIAANSLVLVIGVFRVQPIITYAVLPEVATGPATTFGNWQVTLRDSYRLAIQRTSYRGIVGRRFSENAKVSRPIRGDWAEAEGFEPSMGLTPKPH